MANGVTEKELQDWSVQLARRQTVPGGIEPTSWMGICLRLIDEVRDERERIRELEDRIRAMR